MTISEIAKRKATVAMFVMAVTMTGGKAVAAPTETDEQKAVTLFETGRKLARDGKCSEAIAPLLESVRYAEGVGPLLNLGNCYETLGKTASAYRYFLRAQEVAIARDDKRREEATQRVKSLEKDLSTLTIHVPGSVRSSTTDIRITVDGEAWKSERWDTPVPIDAGPHEIEIAMPSRPKEHSTINVKPQGDRVSFRVSAPSTTATLPASSAPIATTTTTTPPRAAENPSSSSPQRTLGLVTGGVGAAGLVAGAIFGVISLSAHSTVVGRCASYPRCPESDRVDLENLNSRAESAGTISTISFISGAILIGLGATLFFTAK